MGTNPRPMNIKLPAEVGLQKMTAPIPPPRPKRPSLPSRYVLQKKQLFRVRGEPLFILSPA